MFQLALLYYQLQQEARTPQRRQHISYAFPCSLITHHP